MEIFFFWNDKLMDNARDLIGQNARKNLNYYSSFFIHSYQDQNKFLLPFKSIYGGYPQSSYT